MTSNAARRLIVALDYDRLGPACALAKRLAGRVGMFKVGSELFTAEGPAAVKKLARLGARIFLDLKFHDIPNTVARGVATAADLPGVEFVDIHALGGVEMMRAAVEAVVGRRHHPKLIAVTILTSLDAAALRQVGIAGPPARRVVQLAKMAQRAGLDGVVASAHETRAIRRACGDKFLVVVPGIRPAGGARQDQARMATPGEAIRAGADFLVVGRPITAARDPRAAAAQIVAEIWQARRSRI